MTSVNTITKGADSLSALSLKPITSEMCREVLREKDAELAKQFSPKHKVRKLLKTRARHIDNLLQVLWQQQAPSTDNLALVGTGGYGREELHPHSDIDLLILIKDGNTDAYRDFVKDFVAFLWELKLNISHSTRNISGCIEFSKDNLAFFTSLMESRCIAGSRDTHKLLMQEINTERLWPSQKFCTAKIQEQRDRESRYSDISFNLEPDIKNSPGGLRELQTLLWITHRHFGTRSITRLTEHMFLTASEARVLIHARDFLWRLRYLMHMHSGRNQDRLGFDLQHKIAKSFGYQDTERQLAVEAFMGSYYRWVSKLRVASNLLIRHFEEYILLACKSQRTKQLNARFRLRNQYIEVKNNGVFRKYPGALLEIFMLMAQDDNIIGIRVATLRLIYKHRFLIDAHYRANPKHSQYFMGILKSGERVGEVLEIMRRYEILGRWLPEFAKLHGQMQHDLYHVYTVDVHLLAVVRNINGLIYPDSKFTLISHVSEDSPQKARANMEMRSDFALPTQVARRTPKPELLYIAALYHDIAKGRGGDHSTLGVRDVQRFAKKHGLHHSDASLLRFLVRHHLLMSITAQKRDYHDPEILQNFSKVVGNIERLNHLYVLTVADICGTSPKLWNGWRASLLHQLYLSARQWLLRGTQPFTDRNKYLRSVQDQALLVLKQKKLPVRKIKALWNTFDSEYFMREKLDDIVWQTHAIISHNKAGPLVIARESGEFKFVPAVQIFTYCKNQTNILSILGNTLERKNADIQYAHIIDTTDNNVLCVFFVLPRIPDASQSSDAYRKSLTNALVQVLSTSKVKLKSVRHLDPPTIKSFSAPLQIMLGYEKDKPYNILEITTIDRFGLLSCLTQSLDRLKLQLRGARITTLGERVDDIFYITDEDGAVIQDDKKRAVLEDKLRLDIESWINAGVMS